MSSLIIEPVPPFRLDLTAWALRRRRRNAIDRWDGTTYRRLIIIAGRETEVEVTQTGSAATPCLRVTATPGLQSQSERRIVRSALDRLLGTTIDLTGWYRLADTDPRLGPLAARFRGMKPPRFLTVFEALVNAIACQQLSLDVGLELLNRFAVLCNIEQGSRLPTTFRFPTASEVAKHPVASFRAIGFSKQKADALVALARRVRDGEIVIDHLTSGSDAEVCSRLQDLQGVGRWTSEYVLLRGLGRLHVFPGDDVGARKNLARWLGRRAPMDYVAVSQAVHKWHPFAGLVYFHLLLDSLSRSGVLDQASPPEAM